MSEGTIKDWSPGHIPIIRAILDVVYTVNDPPAKTLLNEDSSRMLAMEGRSRLNALEEELDALRGKVDRFGKAKKKKAAQKGA